MYHVIASPPATARFPDLFVDPGTFQAQMSWLARHGYSAVSLNEVNDAWFKDGKLPEKPVVLSFDDGYRGDYVYARPTLRRLRWPGVLNLLIGNLGSELTDRWWSG
jgi:peptidoglycan/xylan/chitin deacetylase (PgdA/CDA1 family)